MKKRLLTVLLAATMTLTMAPAVYAAQREGTAVGESQTGSSDSSSTANVKQTDTATTGKVGAGKEPAEVKAADTKVVDTDYDNITAIGHKDGTGALISAVTAALSNKDKAKFVSDSVLEKAAYDVANDNTVTEADAKAALGISDETKVYVVVQPYIQVELITVSAVSSDANTKSSFTLDITPMYRTVATTADPSKSNAKIITTDDVKGQEGKTANAVIIGTPTELNVTNPVEMTIPLPSGFADGDDKLFVDHLKEGTYEANYIYTGNVSDDKNSLTLTNPHGFSDSWFTISDMDSSVAKIGDVGYTTLQAAVDNYYYFNDEDENIVLKKGGQEATVSENKIICIEGDKNDNTLTATIKAAPGFKVTISSTGTTPTGEPYTTYTITEDSNAADKFTDVSKDSTYRDAIAWAVENKITDGTSSTTFSPKKTCTRAEIVTFLYRLAGSPKVNAVAKFGDVSADNYFASAVAWAVENGITVGTSDTTFSPYQSCTRAEAMTFLYRYEKSPAATGSNKFADVKDGAYYENSVAWGVQNGITNGTSDTTFSPEQSCTREQIVTFLYRDATKK